MKHRISQFYPYIWSVLGLIVLYLVTRLTNLTGLPIFTDEAIYIRWSQIGGSDANWRFISLTDGKQPLFTWIMMVTLRLFNDPLVAGRMVSVISGMFTSLGLAVLSYELFRSKKISGIAVFLYVISPFALMYDRLAIYDSLSAAIAVWNVYLAVLLVKRVRLDVALLFGLSLGLGMLNKTSGFIAIYLLPSTLLLFDWKKKLWKKEFVRWILFAGIAFVLSQIVYGILRLSPFYHMIAQKDTVFVHAFTEWNVLFPFFLGKLKGLLEWLIGYLTVPIFISALMAPFIILKKQKGSSNHFFYSILILIYAFVPIVALSYFGKVLYPRFILFMAVPLLILAAYSFVCLLEKTKRQYFVFLVSAVMLFPSIRTSYFIVTDPLYAPIPMSDRGQLIDDWPAGYGTKEVLNFLQQETNKGKIAVFTDGTFGLFPYAIEIYMVQNPNIVIKGVWPLPKEMPIEMQESALSIPTYFIMNQTQVSPPDWSLEFLSEYQKGTNKGVKLRLYRVIPQTTKVSSAAVQQ